MSSETDRYALTDEAGITGGNCVCREQTIYDEPTKLRPGYLESTWEHQKDLRRNSITKSHSFSLGPSDPHSQLKKENLGCFGGMQRGPTMQMASPR